MQLRIKQSGLQKTQDRKSSPSHWHDHPMHWKELWRLESRPASSLCMS